jgi:hypothetical protein
VTTERGMDPRDLELLRRILSGERSFQPEDGEPADAPRWLRMVERLRLLRQFGYIRMPEPEQYYQQPGYPDVGPCELTAAGYDVLEVYGR